MVTHPVINAVQRGLTSVNRRELVFCLWCKPYSLLYAIGKATLKKNVASLVFSGITSFAGSKQIISFSILTCAISCQGGTNKMAAANFLWLHFLNNRSSIQSFFEISAFNRLTH